MKKKKLKKELRKLQTITKLQGESIGLIIDSVEIKDKITDSTPLSRVRRELLKSIAHDIHQLTYSNYELPWERGEIYE